MKVIELCLRHFRCFEDATLAADGHVVLTGEPRAGRTAAAEGLSRVLGADSTRGRLPDPSDFYAQDLSVRAEVEVTLGSLGDALEEAFFDQLELWSQVEGKIVEESEDFTFLDSGEHEFVLRLAYRAEWVEDEQQATHWVDFVKSSDPANAVFNRVSWPDRKLLPFAIVRRGRALDLGTRGAFRRMVDAADGADFATQLQSIEERIRAIAEEMSTGIQVSTVIEELTSLASETLAQRGGGTDPSIAFAPEGGGIAGLLRSLQPTLDLGGDAGPLPMDRQGASVGALFALCEGIAAADRSAVVVVDDFGDGVDTCGAQHFAALFQAKAGQVWLTTRRAEIASAFRAEELLRIAISPDGTRTVHRNPRPTTRAERLAARHMTLQLLPAAASRAVAVLEGPHDKAALDALVRRRWQDGQVAMPAAHGITLVHAGAADGSGGASKIPPLATAARNLGLVTIGVIDWDRGTGAAATLAATLPSCDAVVRLPDGFAIEKALTSGLSDDALRTAVSDACASCAIPTPPGLDSSSGDALQDLVVRTLKTSGGLHAQFVDALPAGALPNVACQLLDEIVKVVVENRTGHQQVTT